METFCGGYEAFDRACPEKLDKPSLLDLEFEPLFYGVRNQFTSMRTPPLFVASTILMNSDRFFGLSSSAFVKYTHGENVVEMAKKYGSKISAYPQSVGPIGIILSPHIIRDFQVDYLADSCTRFSRVEKVFSCWDFFLPYRPRKLLAEEAKETIDSIQSLDDAERVLALYGVGFFQSAVFGAVMIWSGRSSTVRTAAALSRAIESEAFRASKNRLKLTPTETYRTVADGAIEYWVQAKGGTPELILEGKEEEWMNSVEANPVIVDKKLAPLSDLAIEGSVAEHMLRCAIQRRCHVVLKRFKTKPVFPGPGLYCIRPRAARGEGSLSNAWYLHAGCKHNSRGSHSTWVTCSKADPPVNPPMLWNIVHTSQEDCETYSILTTALEHGVGWGLDATRSSFAEKLRCLRGKSERSDDSTWIHAHKRSLSKWRIESSGVDTCTFRVILDTKNKMNDWMLAVDFHEEEIMSPMGPRLKTERPFIESSAYVFCHRQGKKVPRSLCVEWVFEKVPSPNFRGGVLKCES